MYSYLDNASTIKNKRVYGEINRGVYPRKMKEKIKDFNNFNSFTTAYSIKNDCD